MESSVLFPELDKKSNFPVVKICDFVHLVEDGFCMAGIVSGIPENYEESGQIILHIMLPIPQTPAVCAPGTPVYEFPKENTEIPNKTWHFPDDCKCQMRIPSKAPNRIVVPNVRVH